MSDPTFFQTVYADPPWYEQGGGKCKRGADRHYPLMKAQAIAAYMSDLAIAENAHLWMWVTNNHLVEGLNVMNMLGFRYVTNRVWVKTTKDGSGVATGLGQYVRGGHELLLFGVKGKVPYKEGEEGRARCVVSSVILAPRQEHSRKPDQVYLDIERTSPGPYLEVFARQRWPGWTACGNETGYRDVQATLEMEI